MLKSSSEKTRHQIRRRRGPVGRELPERSASQTCSLKGFPNYLKFEQRNETEPIFENTLPEELPVLVISELDTTSIERFAGVGRRVRFLDPGYGGIYFRISLSIVADFFSVRDLVRATYKPPQISDLKLLTPVVQRVLFDYRRVYVG